MRRCLGGGLSFRGATNSQNSTAQSKWTSCTVNLCPIHRSKPKSVLETLRRSKFCLPVVSSRSPGS